MWSRFPHRWIPALTRTHFSGGRGRRERRGRNGRENGPCARCASPLGHRILLGQAPSAKGGGRVLRLSMVSSWRTWAGGAHACLPSRTRQSAAACTDGHVGRAGNGGRDGKRTTRSWNRVSALLSRRLASSPAPAPNPSDPGGPSPSSRHLCPNLCRPCLRLCCSCEAANPGLRLLTRANHRAWAPGVGLASSSYSWSSWGSRGTRAWPFVHSAHVSPDAAAFEKVSKAGRSGRVAGARARPSTSASASASASADVSLLGHEGGGARGHSSTGRSEHGRVGRWAVESTSSSSKSNSKRSIFAAAAAA